MSIRRATKQATPLKPPTFGEALRDMRMVARDGVHEAISYAVGRSPSDRARGRPRKAHEAAGQHASALFDGVIDAVAEAIVESAKPGAEHVMAQLVAQMLVARVYQHTCHGSA